MFNQRKPRSLIAYNYLVASKYVKEANGPKIRNFQSTHADYVYKLKSNCMYLIKNISNDLFRQVTHSKNKRFNLLQ